MSQELATGAATAAPPQADQAPRRSRRRWPHPALIGVAAVALAVRLPAVDFGLPDLLHPDEPANVAVGVSLADHHALDPHHFSYPSLMYDVIAIVRLVGRIIAGPRSPVIDLAQNLGIGRTTDPLLFTELRLIVMAFSVAMCLVVWSTVRWVTGNVWAATLAGLSGALSPILVTNGVFITPDTYSAFFVAAALAGAVLLYRKGRRWDYLLAGLAVGLSAGAKYNAAVVAVAPLVAHVARHGRASLRTADRLVLTGLMSVVAFVVTTPTALFHPHEFVTSALKELNHYQTGHAGVTGSSFGFYMATLRHDSILWLVAAVLAVGALLGRNRLESLIVGAYGVAYVVLVSTQAVHFDRDILPLLPALLLLAGFGIAAVHEALAERETRRVAGARAGTVGLAGLGALALVLPAISATKVADRLSDHPRAEARGWLEAHLHRGAHIVVEPYGPWIPPGRFVVIPHSFVVVGGAIPQGTTAVVVSEAGSGRYLDAPRAYPSQLAAYRAFTGQWCLARQFADGPWIRIFTPCG